MNAPAKEAIKEFLSYIQETGTILEPTSDSESDCAGFEMTFPEDYGYVSEAILNAAKEGDA